MRGLENGWQTFPHIFENFALQFPEKKVRDISWAPVAPSNEEP
jgi:hypothetical protein